MADTEERLLPNGFLDPLVEARAASPFRFELRN
jgi:hypothetical protein